MKPVAVVRCDLLFVATLGMLLGFTAPATGAEGEHPGRAVFVSKGCATCHEERAVLQAPHLSVLRKDRSLVQLTAAMWNQAPIMWANLQDPGLRWPRLTAREMAALAQYLNGAAPEDPSPDLGRGQVVLVEKGCARCHSPGGEGGNAAKDLLRRVRFDSKAAWAAALWNHAPTMLALAAERGAEYPLMQPGELADLIGFLREMARPR